MEKILVNPEILWAQFEEIPSETEKELDHNKAFSFTISGTEVINPISVIVSKVTEEFNWTFDEFRCRAITYWMKRGYKE